MAADGKMALELFHSTQAPYDLIICDWMMPNLDGLELLQNIRGSGNSTKFLMLTANLTKEAVTAAIDAGIDAYVTKPFTVDEIHKKVRLVTKDIPRPI